MIQGCLSERMAAVSRGDLTDAEWRILNPLLPDRGERCASAAGASSGCGMRYSRRWRALGLPPTRNMPSIPRLCGRTNMPPEQKGESKTEALGRSRGGLSTKIRLRTNGEGNPLSFDE